MWVYLPDHRTALAFVLEEAGSIWASCSQSPDSTPDASSKLTNTRDRASSPRSAPDTSPRPRSGMTSQPSTQSHLPEHSTPFLQDTPASRSAKPGSAAARTTSGTSGLTLPGSSESLDTASNGSSSKMSPAMSLSALRPFCATYGDWASRLRLACSRRLKRARRMKDSGSLLWPTAKALTGGANSQREARGAGGPDLQEAAQNWQTPRVATGEYTRDNGQKGAERLTLEGQAALWGTPRSSDAEKGGPNQRFGAGGMPLPAQAAQWPTPSAMQDTKGDADIGAIQRREAKDKQIALAHRARTFSPPAHPTEMHGSASFEARRISLRLFRSAASNVPATTLRRWLSKGAWRKARLNPLFVEWLMGWPPGHALCDCSATEFALWQRHTRGALSALPTAYGPWIWMPAQEPSPHEQMSLFDEIDQ